MKWKKFYNLGACCLQIASGPFLCVVHQMIPSSHLLLRSFIQLYKLSLATTYLVYQQHLNFSCGQREIFHYLYSFLFYYCNDYLGLAREKVLSSLCGEQLPRSICTFVQSDQGLSCPLTESKDTTECMESNAWMILGTCAGWSDNAHFQRLFFFAWHGP